MTHEEVVDDLPSMLTGELGRTRLLDVVAHLRDCADCRTELAEVAAAHGALTAARGALADPADLPLPVLHPVAPARARHAPVARLVAAAVVVALALSALALSGRWLSAGGGAGPASATRRAALVAVGPKAPAASGVVQMSGPAGRTDMTIRTSGLPPVDPGHFYYAWLLDPATNKMLPLGVVAVDALSTFEVQSDLVGRYKAVDISLQADDGNPAHSPVSVLRASYA